jgi:nicotinamidase-related amidase
VEISPSSTAVIAIHVERDVIEVDRPFGRMFNEMVVRTGLLDNFAKVLDAARAAGALVVYAKVAFPPGSPDLDTGIPLYAAVAEANALVSGSDGVEVVAELAPADGDVAFEHVGTSAFVGGVLERELAERGIDTLLIGGVATNAAVEGTARDAANRGFKTYLIADCCSAADDAAHAASLESLGLITHGVVSSGEVTAALGTE